MPCPQRSTDPLIPQIKTALFLITHDPPGTLSQHTPLRAREHSLLLTSDPAVYGGRRHRGEGVDSLIPAAELCTVR